MQVTVRTHHVEITDALKEYAESKLSRLDKFYEGIVSIDANLKIENTSDDNQQLVEVNIQVPGNTIRATEGSRDMYASIDVVYDKCESQLRKYKEKRHDHSEGNHPVSSGVTRSESEKDRLYVPKPMTPEDAIHHIGTQPFLMFRNSETMEINVLYPLKEEGGFGLIEP